jgi:hypothetical protein
MPVSGTGSSAMSGVSIKLSHIEFRINLNCYNSTAATESTYCQRVMLYQNVSDTPISTIPVLIDNSGTSAAQVISPLSYENKGHYYKPLFDKLFTLSTTGKGTEEWIDMKVKPAITNLRYDAVSTVFNSGVPAIFVTNYVLNTTGMVVSTTCYARLWFYDI